MRAWKIVVLSLCVGLMAGCVRKEKVVATEGPAVMTYESLGSLEVKERAWKFGPSRIMRTGVEVVTLTMADTESDAEVYRRSLREKLAETARKQFKADAVVNVTYWPDPESAAFPKGYIHARGEMIRYVPFSSKVASAKG